jgi:hypothetical protein
VLDTGESVEKAAAEFPGPVGADCHREWLDRSRYEVLVRAARDDGREPTKLEMQIWGDVLELREALRAETRESNKRLWIVLVLLVMLPLFYYAGYAGFSHK